MTDYPHLDPTWVDEFILEARLRDAPGSAIGAALAEADSHCAESGESAQDAFGAADRYAAELALPAREGSLLAASVGGIVSIVGVLALPQAAGAWRGGTDVPVTVGGIAVVVLTAALVALISARQAAALRWLLHRPAWQQVLLGLVPLALFVVALLVAPTVLFTVPAPLMVIIGGAATLVGPVLTWKTLRTDPDIVVVEPDQAPTRAPRGTALFTVLMLPVVTLILTAIALVG